MVPKTNIARGKDSAKKFVSGKIKRTSVTEQIATTNATKPLRK